MIRLVQLHDLLHTRSHSTDKQQYGADLMDRVNKTLLSTMISQQLPLPIRAKFAGFYSHRRELDG